MLHGLTTQFAVGAVAPFPGRGEVDTSMPRHNTYNALLPIATAKFEVATADDIPPVVPLPAGIGLMGAALGSLGLVRRLRGKTRA